MLTAIIIFALTYLFISFQNIPGIHLNRCAASLAGAAAMAGLGIVTLPEAYRLVDLDTLVFILGMMIVIGYMEVSGFFELLEHVIIRKAATTRHLLALVIGASGLLSALFMNDTICLMLTPIVLRAVTKNGLNPNPYLIALATSANIGSAFTPMGNPQNMIIAIHSGVSFKYFVTAIAPVAAAGLVLNYFIMLRCYKEEFAAGKAVAFGEKEHFKVKTRLLYVCLGAMVLLLGLFAADVKPPLAAICVAGILIIAGATRPREAFKNVDWELLLMFASLFVVMGGLRKSGALTGLFGWLEGLTAAPEAAKAAAVAASSSVLSNLVSNVPCVVFYTNLLPHMGNSATLWLVLAAATTIAGNLTIIGSVANLIVFESARKQTRIGFWEYSRAALPLAVFLIAGSTLWLVFLGR